MAIPDDESGSPPRGLLLEPNRGRDSTECVPSGLCRKTESSREQSLLSQGSVMSDKYL